jgi:hypothetical protein
VEFFLDLAVNFTNAYMTTARGEFKGKVRMSSMLVGLMFIQLSQMPLGALGTVATMKRKEDLFAIFLWPHLQNKLDCLADVCASFYPDVGDSPTTFLEDHDAVPTIFSPLHLIAQSLVAENVLI